MRQLVVTLLFWPQGPLTVETLPFLRLLARGGLRFNQAQWQVCLQLGLE